MRTWLPQLGVWMGLCAVVMVMWFERGDAIAEGHTESPALMPAMMGEDVSPLHPKFAALETISPGVQVNWQVDGQTARMVTRLSVPTKGGSDEAQATSFLSAWAPALGLDGVEYAFIRVMAMNGLRAVHFQQMHGELPVYQRYIVVTLDDGGVVRSLSSDAIPLRSVEELKVGEDVANAVANAAVYRGRLPDGVVAPMSARQVVVADPASAIIAWHVQVAMLPWMTPVDVLVDGRDGRVLLVRDSVQH